MELKCQYNPAGTRRSKENDQGQQELVYHKARRLSTQSTVVTSSCMSAYGPEAWVLDAPNKCFSLEMILQLQNKSHKSNNFFKHLGPKSGWKLQ